MITQPHTLQKIKKSLHAVVGVRAQVVYGALKILKEINPYYADIIIDQSPETVAAIEKLSDKLLQDAQEESSPEMLQLDKDLASNVTRPDIDPTIMGTPPAGIAMHTTASEPAVATEPDSVPSADRTATATRRRARNRDLISEETICFGELIDHDDDRDIAEVDLTATVNTEDDDGPQPSDVQLLGEQHRETTTDDDRSPGAEAVAVVAKRYVSKNPPLRAVC